MEQIHVAAHQLVVAAQLLDAELAVMDEEFQVERGDVGAGVALAAIVHHHHFDGPTKGHVGIFHQLHKSLAADGFAPQRIADDRVACRTGDNQWRAVVVDEQFQQRLKNLLGVLQLRFAQKHCIAGDVADDQKAGVGCHLPLPQPHRTTLTPV